MKLYLENKLAGCQKRKLHFADAFSSAYVGTLESVAAENRENPCSARVPIKFWFKYFNLKRVCAFLFGTNSFFSIFVLLCGETTFLTV